MIEDRNFDDLADRFNERIYNTPKGQLRLEILHEDLKTLHAGPTLDIWDAGCGQGQISLWFAKNQHTLTLCDISAVLLAQAQAQFQQAGLPATFFHESAQRLAEHLPTYDLVISHAVVEWLADPMDYLEKIISRVKNGGHLSLMFYNRNAMVYQNVLRGGWRLQPIIEDRYIGVGNRLSPPHPQYPEDVVTWLQTRGFTLQKYSGIRVFNDYLSHQAREITQTEELMFLERQYCRKSGFREMGRYVHLLVQKNCDTENK